MKFSALTKRSRKEQRAAITHYDCSIDCCFGRVISGWVVHKIEGGQAVSVRLCIGEEIWAEGVAGIFRQDLLDVGIGDGYHGFHFLLDRHLPSNKPLELKLFNSESGELISGALIPALGKPAQLSIQKLDLAGIAGEVIAGDKPLDASEIVCVRADGAIVASASCIDEGIPGRLSFRMALAPHLFDGNPHVFEADLANSHARGNWETGILPAIPTSLEIISDASRELGYAGLAKNASRRYDALRKQLSHAAEHTLPQAHFANLMRAHDVLVEGHHQRRDFPLITLPNVDHPKVSIIIPVYNQFALTYQCLASIVLCAAELPFEVILIDDCSSDETQQVADIVENLQVIRNQDNLGFLHSCNKAASQASGEYLVLLNNDTEVTAGWLEELLSVFGRFSRVGAVGAKLVYPDGSLQDAGGIVWDSGTPWNVGHGQNPEDPAYNYVREVDYLTAAALMVSRDAWQAVEGFSAGYAPAYYEDTDLSFKLREAGYRTVYCPHATVIHYEGQSNGTSVESGIKRYQQINADRFTRTWRHAFAGLGAEGVNLARNKDRCKDFRVLMIDHAFPCLGQDAGSYAAVQEMRLLIELGCKVTFVPHNFQHMGKHTSYLQKLGVECIHAPFCTSVGVFLERRGDEFDAVYITRYDVAERVLPDIRSYTTAKVLFNNADLHFLREMRAALARGETDLEGPRQTRDRELAVMDSVDAVLSYNDAEHTIIASHLMRSDHIHTCPWVLNDQLSEIAHELRHGIAFLGGFGHPPNREAVKYFIDQVLPLVRAQRPCIQFHIWGSQIPQDFSDMLEQGVVVEGYADTLDDVFHTCRVFVAPLLSGAGIKGKVLDSVAYGVPSVLSPIAAEATGLVDQVSTYIATSPEEWTERIIQLYDDPVRWQSMAEQAHKLVSTKYSFDSGLAQMSAIFESVDLLQSGGTRERLLLC